MQANSPDGVSALLPPGMQVFERGWLSSNNVLFQGPAGTALVDSGYVSHSVQTVELIQHALRGRSLDLLVNTHLHSDHCGGNAALQRAYPKLRTLIPPGEAAYVSAWDEEALTYAATGQRCAKFRFDDLLRPGSLVDLGGRAWQVHAAPGHDANSVVLFEPLSRCLISADALWESGFGVVFPEITGGGGFDEVAETLDLIESLNPLVIVPGHGSVFSDVAAALTRARERLDRFRARPERHAVHAGKVLIKFWLLDVQRVGLDEFEAWVERTPYLGLLAKRYAPGKAGAWATQLLQELISSGAARADAESVMNA